MVAKLGNYAMKKDVPMQTRLLLDTPFMSAVENQAESYNNLKLFHYFSTTIQPEHENALATYRTGL